MRSSSIVAGYEPPAGGVTLSICGRTGKVRRKGKSHGMKILVFSDSHGNVEHMAEAVERDRPDRIFHLGDVEPDARALRRRFPDIPMDCVPGNCDGRRPDLEEEKLVEAEGRRILLMHGHTRNVKLGMGQAVWAAREAEADVLLFGHTHEAFCTYEQGLWIMNPGTVRGSWAGATYGVITIQGGDLVCYGLKV